MDTQVVSLLPRLMSVAQTERQTDGPSIRPDSSTSSTSTSTSRGVNKRATAAALPGSYSMASTATECSMKSLISSGVTGGLSPSIRTDRDAALLGAAVGADR
eukprot:Selendium_serpulae@DN8164_c0_g1_i1.p1